MRVVKEHPNGVFCWAHLATTDSEGTKRFYESLFGWETDEQGIPGGRVHLMFKLGGYDVAGGGQMDPAMQAQGVPSFWTSFVKHDNADAMAAKITEAGGTLMFPPMDVGEDGRMVVGQDPAGAAFGVWQPKNHIGAQLINQPNTLSWSELQTPDAERALNFYNKVFGWTGEKDATGYVTISTGEGRQAGMMAMDERGEDIPPNWAVYFAVEDIDTSAAKAEELGGRLLVPVAAAGDIGRFAVVQDPQGAVFSIIQFSIPADPPPGY